MTEFEFEGGRFIFRDCIVCGVRHAMPAVLIQRDRKSGGYRYCPNGHQMGWSKDMSEDEKIRRERDSLRQNNARLIEEAAAARRSADQAAKEAKAAKAKAARVQTRASAGVCPCCNRTVRQMAAHMRTKHPEFKATAVN